MERVENVLRTVNLGHVCDLSPEAIEEKHTSFAMYGKQQKIIRIIKSRIKNLNYQRKNIIVVDYDSAYKKLTEISENIEQEEKNINSILKTNDLEELRAALIEANIIDNHTPCLEVLVDRVA